MSKITRISTTLTARYSPASGATDAFWLDGRIMGVRETRAADITLDREDKGFFFATYATQSSGDSRTDLSEVKAILDKTHLEIKHSNKNIDNQITDLAECAVGVAGRMSLQHEGVRQPFFAGIMVKDSEIAAVTMGRGCAYLYRNDTLYPLTKEDVPFEAIDYSGKAVPNIDIYCAGIAGTVRYSNIAQLQVDDCIIVCNREVMDAIGQREMLRILYESEDQSDAAGAVITAAAAKLPGTPIQFMIGFVESITTGEKALKSGAFPLSAKAGATDAKASAADAKASAANVKSFAQPTTSRDDDEYASDDRNDDDYDDDLDEDEDENAGSVKRFALIAIIAIVILACAFAIYTIVFGNRGNNNKPTPTPTGIVSSEAVSSTSSISQVSSAGGITPTLPAATPTTGGSVTISPTGAAVGLPTTHTIAKGELLPAIAQRYYKSTAKKYLDAIVSANIAKYPDFSTEYYQQGWIITIPVV
ncbi:MAG: hypothetical protein ACYCYI_09755 [Saccharofermentanales bacterium]